MNTKTYQSIIYFLIGFTIGAALASWKIKKHVESEVSEFKNTIENLNHAHINDSLWNEYLQDSLDVAKGINDSLLLKTENIRTKSNESYDKKIRSIDNITLDSAISLRADQRRQFRSTYGQ